MRPKSHILAFFFALTSIKFCVVDCGETHKASNSTKEEAGEQQGFGVGANNGKFI